MKFKDRFKNATRPGKWKVTGDDLKSGAAAYATGGLSLLAQELTGSKSPEGAAKSLWDDVTGKKSADAAKQEAAEAQARQLAEVDKGKAYTQSQVDAGRGYVQQGTADAANALGYYHDRAEDQLGSGYDAARDTLTGMVGQGPQAYDALSQQPGRLADLYSGGLGRDFTTDPGYQFRLQQGQDAIAHAASAAGGRHGGNTLKALVDYNQNFASNEFDKYANRQMGLAGAADQNELSALLNQAGRNDQMAATGYQGDLGLTNALAGAAQNYTQNLAGASNQQGQTLGQLYTGQGSQLAGLGMQGAGINAGLTQSAIGALAPQGGPQQPTGLQQLIGLGATGLGAYLGGPAGAAVGGQAANVVTNANTGTV
jgi:hypothetical protein